MVTSTVPPPPPVLGSPPNPREDLTGEGSRSGGGSPVTPLSLSIRAFRVSHVVRGQISCLFLEAQQRAVVCTNMWHVLSRKGV